MTTKRSPIGVPKWDYDAIIDCNYDTSAAAITASAFFELFQYTKNNTYKNIAYLTLNTLSTNVTLKVDSNKNLDFNSPAVLKANEHDCSSIECTVIETDYYFLEALRRMNGDFNQRM
tara:strand:+ start:195 stop:545 length:351 start_codon:yes stop_codon:yes gene_type:complete